MCLDMVRKLDMCATKSMNDDPCLMHTYKAGAWLGTSCVLHMVLYMTHACAHTHTMNICLHAYMPHLYAREQQMFVHTRNPNHPWTHMTFIFFLPTIRNTSH